MSREGSDPEEGLADAPRTPRPCAVCGHRDPVLVSVLRVPGLPRFDIVRCARCGLVYVDPQPLSEQLLGYYSDYDDYLERFHRGEHTEVIDPNQMRRYRRQLRHLRAYAPGRGRLLDYGCALGHFLDSARRDGWETYGLELSPEAAAEARARGHQVTLGPARDDSFPDGSFDAVVMSHSIEHLVDPRAELVRVSRWLRSEGLLAVYTPNERSYWYRLLAVRRRMGTPSAGWMTTRVLEPIFGRDEMVRSLSEGGVDWIEPRLNDPSTLRCTAAVNLLHVFLFTRASLRRLLETSGFTVVAWPMGSVDRPPGALKRLLKNRVVDMLLALAGRQEELAVLARADAHNGVR